MVIWVDIFPIFISFYFILLYFEPRWRWRGCDKPEPWLKRFFKEIMSNAKCILISFVRKICKTRYLNLFGNLLLNWQNILWRRLTDQQPAAFFCSCSSNNTRLQHTQTHIRTTYTRQTNKIICMQQIVADKLQRPQWVTQDIGQKLFGPDSCTDYAPQLTAMNTRIKGYGEFAKWSLSSATGRVSIYIYAKLSYCGRI